MSNINVQIRFYGAFRRFGESISLPVPAGSTLHHVKIMLSKKLDGNEAKLVFDSAIADDNSILNDDKVLYSDGMLCILPPVCGG